MVQEIEGKNCELVVSRAITDGCLQGANRGGPH
jgi:hypothetical protein